MAGAILAGGTAATWAAAPDNLETAVLAEINFARTHPAAYAETLRKRDPSEWRRDDRGDDYAMPGQSARAEAIAFLDRQRPLSPLGANLGLAGAAARLAEDQAQSGRIGHTSALRERFEAHGVWSGMVAETISYGMESPAAVVQQLIIDEGVPGRGHRGVLFDPSLSVAGVSCGPHRTYGRMCVIDFAGAVVKR
jgi:hypothetical protein